MSQHWLAATSFPQSTASERGTSTLSLCSTVVLFHSSSGPGVTAQQPIQRLSRVPKSNQEWDVSNASQKQERACFQTGGSQLGTGFQCSDQHFSSNKVSPCSRSYWNLKVREKGKKSWQETCLFHDYSDCHLKGKWFIEKSHFSLHEAWVSTFHYS